MSTRNLPSPLAPPRTRNPRTQAMIQRETLWQVYVPIGFLGLLALAAMIAVCLPGAFPTRSPLADVSLMFLILIWGAIGFFALVLAVGFVALLWFGLRELPYLFKRIQDFFWVMSRQTKSMTTQVDNRIVGVHLSYAALDSIISSFRAIFTPRRAK